MWVACWLQEKAVCLTHTYTLDNAAVEIATMFDDEPPTYVEFASLGEFGTMKKPGILSRCERRMNG